MGHPTAYGQPDHMTSFQKLEDHCSDPPCSPPQGGDCGGVHTNSGIPNNAFYLMVMGGANDTSKIEVTHPLGWEGARRVWWNSQRHDLSVESDFSQAARAQVAAAKKTHVARDGVACAWVATGVLDADYVARYKIPCGAPDASTMTNPADTNDGGGAQPDDGSADVDLKDSCMGRADGVYCRQVNDFGAIVCMGESIVGGLQCPDGQKCVGPNGPGTDIQCQ
jgi:hypothetical protein